MQWHLIGVNKINKNLKDDRISYNIILFSVFYQTKFLIKFLRKKF